MVALREQVAILRSGKFAVEKCSRCETCSHFQVKSGCGFAHTRALQLTEAMVELEKQIVQMRTSIADIDLINNDSQMGDISDGVERDVNIADAHNTGSRLMFERLKVLL